VRREGDICLSFWAELTSCVCKQLAQQLNNGWYNSLTTVGTTAEQQLNKGWDNS